MELKQRYDLVKTRVHSLLDGPVSGNRGTAFVQIFLAFIILLNTVAIILFTEPIIEAHYSFLLNPLINGCLLIFTIEYLLRIWSCTFSRDIKGKITDRIRYAMHLYLLIDLISIIPVFFPFIFHRNLATLRMFRLISIFKLGRYSRYSRSLAQLKRVLIRKREIFGIMLFFLIFIVLFSATILYLVENPVQPDKFSSIPAAMWWAAMTVTTVGYGDIYPVTPLGKFIASCFTFAGVLVLALPSAILATGFIEEKNRVTEPDPCFGTARAGLLSHFASLHDQEILSDQEYEEYRSMVLCLNPETE